MTGLEFFSNSKALVVKINEEIDHHTCKVLKDKETFKKGEEKGYFEFGGSTIIHLIQKDTVKIDDDILKYTDQNIEVQVKQGTTIGKKIQKRNAGSFSLSAESDQRRCLWKLPPFEKGGRKLFVKEGLPILMKFPAFR